MNELIRPNIAARMLGMSRSTIYRWFWEGRLGGIKLAGGPIRILKSSVEELLNADYPNKETCIAAGRVRVYTRPVSPHGI